MQFVYQKKKAKLGPKGRASFVRRKRSTRKRQVILKKVGTEPKENHLRIVRQGHNNEYQIK